MQWGEHAMGRNLQFPYHSEKYCVTLQTKATYELNVFLTKARRGSSLDAAASEVNKKRVPAIIVATESVSLTEKIRLIMRPCL